MSARDKRAPRIQDRPVRDRALEFLVVAPAIPAGIFLVMGTALALDPAYENVFFAASPPVVLLPLLFVWTARPRGWRHGAVLFGGAFLSTVLGLSGLYLATRAIAIATGPALFGGLLAGMAAGVAVAAGAWLLVRWPGRRAGLWDKPAGKKKKRRK